MTDYTPGPWKVDVLDAADNTCDVIIVRYTPEHADVIAEVSPDAHLESGEGNGWANANLLASAPEMYETLAALLRYISSHQIYDKDARGLIERTLAKARGEA